MRGSGELIKASVEGSGELAIRKCRRETGNWKLEKESETFLCKFVQKHIKALTEDMLWSGIGLRGASDLYSGGE